MKRTKILLISIIVPLLVIIAVLSIFLFKATQKQEKNIIDSFLGDYVMVGYMYRSIDEMAASSAAPPERYNIQSADNIISLKKDSVSFPASPGYDISSGVSSWDNILLLENPKYQLQEITNDFLNNGIYTQGRGLIHNLDGIIPNSDYLAKLQLKNTPYALFVENPVIDTVKGTQRDTFVLYYVDGVYYAAINSVFYRLEKVG